jgi:hypothetical protein
MQISQTFKHKKKKREGNPERKVNLPSCRVQSDQIKYDSQSKSKTQVMKNPLWLFLENKSTNT